ncbi:MAG TPA: thiamine pyrophosphate-binding protein [Micromonosporaceae bacterium]
MKSALAAELVDALKKAGVDFISYLPESRLAEMIPLIHADDAFTVLRTSHEGSAVSIASGAALVGKTPAVYMEGTGFMLSLYHQQSVAIRCGLPVLLLISYVGSAADQRNTITFSGYGAKTEPLLRAMGLPYDVVERGDDLAYRVANMVRVAKASKQPAALLFTGEFTATEVIAA